MKAHLLFPDRDPPSPSAPGPLLRDVVRDLDLTGIFEAMAAGDPQIRATVEQVVLAGGPDPAVVRYRQDALEDALRHPSVVRDLYALVVGALDQEHQIWGFSDRSPSSVLFRSLQVLEVLLPALTRVRELGETRAGGFRSDAFTGLFAAIRREIDAEFFAAASAHLVRLRSRERLLLSTTVGPEARPEAWTLRTPSSERASLWRRLVHREPNALTFTIAERDETGHRLLGELIDDGLTPAAVALGRAADHLVQFLRALRYELGFYVGALNLEDRLGPTGNRLSRPVVGGTGGPSISAQGLYDLGLAVHTGQRLVPNDLAANGQRLVVITGANQGGKSTFLRALGIAQLFGQAGLRVAAERLSTGVASGVYTHFRREEDASTHRGKLEEELSRLRGVVEALRPGGLLLCNESLSSTNEREGSEIAGQVVRALVEGGVSVIFVTFLYEFAQGWYREGRSDSVFLRVEREPDGRRTFRLVPGEPLATGYAEDLGREILGPREAARRSAGAVGS